MAIATVPGLEVRDLYRFYRAVGEDAMALRGVDLMVHAGELVAIVGPSGSGKSTLLSLLAGLDEPTAGEVLIDGVRFSRRPEAERARFRARSVGILRQSGNLFDQLDLLANIRIAQQAAGHRRSDPARAAELLASVGLPDRASAHPGELSGGEVARAGLAVALANEPTVLLADEPTGELDGGNEQRVLELLVAAARAGCSVVLATHSPRVMAVADRVVELREGRVVSPGRAAA
ncbi:MAG: ABC transporter ATP-binding protein [Actinomycetota bacterium]|nr:ABC transporter ATP-binding protein [Actinomycetota bacterium]